MVVGRLLSCLEIFLYQGIVLFEQYKLLKYDPTNANEHERSSYIWILLEITTFYLYISSAIIFLLFIQCRGMLGYTHKKHNDQRYKQDALDYYIFDIDWFAFIFVMMQLHAL